MTSSSSIRTRIVATVGPASWSESVLDALIDAGMDVARVNTAHSRGDDLARLVRHIRERAERKDRPLAVLADLAGPKLRIGCFRDGAVDLTQGQRFELTTEEVEGSAERVSVDYADLSGDVAPGDVVFLNDGLVRLRVREVQGTSIHTDVEIPGPLGDRKGLSVPSAGLRLPSLTEADRAALDVLAETPPDFVSLSFVRSAEDLRLLREAMRERGLRAPVIAKIEKAQAVEALDDIVQEANAIMVARGDLGVECPIEEVPALQKMIIRACNRAGRPVITATQMLESMVSNPRPTRAEATDVANAVLDGSDALMLSAESASGRYPVDAVRMMRRIVEQSERLAPAHRHLPDSPHSRTCSWGEDRHGSSSANTSVSGGGREGAEVQRHAPESLHSRTRSWGDDPEDTSIADGVAHAACLAAESLNAALVVCLTQSGTSARYLARWRPAAPIVAATPHAETWRRLSLLWGVRALRTEEFPADFEAACAQVLEVLRHRGWVDAGSTIVLTAGLPFTQRGRTNTVRVEQV